MAKSNPRFEMDYARGNYEAPVEQALSKHLHAGTVSYDVGLVVRSETHQRCAHYRTCSTKRFGTNSHPALCCLVFQRAPALRARIRAIELQPRGRRNGARRDYVEYDRCRGHYPGRFWPEKCPPDLIKVDVEGAEAAVLRGSERVFATKRPVLICEVHHEDASREVSRWLLERNYSFEWLMDSPNFPRHLLARWHE